MDFLISIMDKIADFMHNGIDFLGLNELSPGLYIIAAGAILVLIGFIIACIAMSKSKTKRGAAALDEVTAYVDTTGLIDENNIDGLNDRIKTLPPHVNKGWQSFLDQQAGYPSDYFCHNHGKKRHHKCKRGAGIGFFKGFSRIAILIVFLITSLTYHAEFVDTTATGITVALIAVIGTIVAPLFLYVICLGILKCLGKKQGKRLHVAMTAFLEALDNNVIVYREEQDDFVSSNVEELNANIDELLINKLDEVETFEIVTTPVADPALLVEVEDIVEDIVEPEEIIEVVEPVAPIAPAEIEPEVVATLDEVAVVEETRQSNLVALVSLIVEASGDETVSAEDIVDLQVLIAKALLDGEYTHPEEQEILTICFDVLENTVR